MNFLGIGPLELVLIIVLALIFLGPDELPVVMRKLAKFLKEMQDLTTDVSEQIREELGPEWEELTEATKEIQEVTQSVRKAQEAVRNPVRALQKEAAESLEVPPLTTSTRAQKDRGEKEEAATEAERIPSRPVVSTRPLVPPPKEPSSPGPATAPPQEHAVSSDDENRNRS